jgi:hypothetical protein
MKINIYDTELNRTAIVGEHFVSCYWVEGFNTTGQFTLELQDQDQYRKAIKEDYFVGRTDRDTLMIVTAVEIKNGKIIASGKTADKALNDSAMMGTIKADNSIDKTVKTMYNNSVKVPSMEYADTDLDISANMQISNRDFQTVSLELAQKNSIGFKVRKNGNTAEAVFYLPSTKNAVFATKYGNLSLDRVYFSNENYKNYAIVLGEGEGENRTRVDVDLSNGGRVRQIIVDARNEQREEGETDEDYSQRLIGVGISKLLEMSKVSAVEIAVPTEDFGKVYDLGDTVTVLLQEYGIKFKTNIARFSQKEQKNKITTKIEVGDIIILR